MKNPIRLAALAGTLLIAQSTFAADRPYVSITPILMPHTASQSWYAAADKAIADALAGELSAARAPTGPSDYVRCNYGVSWENLIVSSNTPMWAGRLDYPAPFDKERGQVVTLLVDIVSSSGADDVSLAPIRIVTASSDGNILGWTNQFGGLEHNRWAPGIKANGTVVTSGATTEKFRRVLVFAYPKRFNGGDTEQGIGVVQRWVESKGNYTLMFAGGVEGDENSWSRASVSVFGLEPSTPVPELLIDCNRKISVANGQLGRSYRLWKSSSLTPAAWQLSAILNAAEPIAVPASGPAGFFRAELQ